MLLSTPTSFRVALALTFALFAAANARSADPNAPNDYLNFVKAQADSLRENDAPPASREAWIRESELTRIRLKAEMGLIGHSEFKNRDIEPQVLGILKRDGYRVEKVVFQTRPGVRMTSNLYLPDAPGKHPAILAVHGHWKGAKQDPVVQARCIGAVKLGFVVLAVDAFGAGERGIGKALGEYHGEMTAATLLPIGQPLSGIQLYENMRAVDYLKSRPEVDGEHIGITGASGGGNQTMYAMALDERFKAGSPVCSVGNYRAYLGVGCCLCEVVPGALKFTEESGVLALTAPRALLVINATRDSPQFSVAEAKKSLAAALPVYQLYDRPDALRHTVFESGHDYSKPMREAVYGWMTKYLKGEGDASPIAEPEIKPEDPEDLRCYPGITRPDDFMTIPKLAASEGRIWRLLGRERQKNLRDKAEVRRSTEKSITVLKSLLGGFPELPPLVPVIESLSHGVQLFHFEPEPGLKLTARVEPGAEKTSPIAIVLDLEGAEKAIKGPIVEECRREGWRVVTLDLRATGKLAWKSDKVGNALDHNTAEWGLWIGRPLIGQWVYDVRRLIDLIEDLDGRLPESTILIGDGPAGLVALAAAATDPRITRVATVGSLASYISDTPYRIERLGVILPKILSVIGDVGDLAALVLPRRVVIGGGVSGANEPLASEVLREAFQPAAEAFSRLADSPRALTILDKDDLKEVIKALK